MCNKETQQRKDVGEERRNQVPAQKDRFSSEPQMEFSEILLT